MKVELSDLTGGLTVFHGLFALSVLDAFFNGPKLRGWAAHALLASSLVAFAVSLVEVDHGWIAIVVVELVWVLAVLESASFASKQAEEEQAKLAASTAAAGKAGQEDKLALPPKALEFVKKSLDSFKLNVSGPTNCLGQPWKLLENKQGVQIYQSDFPGQSCKFWKVEAEIRGTMEQFMKQMFDYDVRATWDTAVGSGKSLKEFTNIPGLGQVVLLQVLTAPQAGGMVSPRELVDLGIMVEQETPNSPFIFANASVPPDMFGMFPEAPKKHTGVRAFGHPGSGSYIEPIPDKPGMYRYVLVNALDLGGWLSTSVINQATAGALMEGTQALLVHLDKTRT
ncbi:hypothetical protein BASA81_002351 [Batrachochytrium salamandrivorans]|nr:hypothetical protein BASA81_002351 [Batrachochytrium salamandrivorans]